MPFSISLSAVWNAPFLSRFRTSPTLTLLAFLLPLPLVLVPRLVASYRTYLSLGPGGIPHNPLGYLMQAAMRPIARRDLRAADPPPYGAPVPAALAERYAPHGLTSFLLLPAAAGRPGPGPGPVAATEMRTRTRTPPRPEVPYFVAPQRQVTQAAAGDMLVRMRGFLGELAARNPSLLELRPSGLEGVGTEAVFLRAGSGGDSGPGEGEGEGKGEEGTVVLPEYMGRAKAEIVHVHDGEGSTHVTLSLVDAEWAVREGWAERHPLSGVMLPWSYVLVYAPRDDVEYEVWTRLVVAGCRFVSGGREIKF